MINDYLSISEENTVLPHVNSIHDRPFWCCSRKGRGLQKGCPSLKSVSHVTMMKLGIGIPYLKKIQKIYKSLDTPLEFW